MMYSDPNDGDTDYDGISDKHDVSLYVNTYEVSVTDKSFEGFDVAANRLFVCVIQSD